MHRHLEDFHVRYDACATLVRDSNSKVTEKKCKNCVNPTCKSRQSPRCRPCQTTRRCSVIQRARCSVIVEKKSGGKVDQVDCPWPVWTTSENKNPDRPFEVFCWSHATMWQDAKAGMNSMLHFCYTEHTETLMRPIFLEFSTGGWDSLKHAYEHSVAPPYQDEQFPLRERKVDKFYPKNTYSPVINRALSPVPSASPSQPRSVPVPLLPAPPRQAENTAMDHQKSPSSHSERLLRSQELNAKVSQPLPPLHELFDWNELHQAGPSSEPPNHQKYQDYSNPKNYRLRNS